VAIGGARGGETLLVGEGKAETVSLVGVFVAAEVEGGWGGGRWRWRDKAWGILKF
jgi:hypothetical protein